jgi:hypothetical protein
MRRLIYAAAILGWLPFAVACEPNVQQEAQDVREAQEDAARNVAEEKQDVDEAAKAGIDNVIEEKRDVEDAAKEGAKNIEEEKRELEDAARKEATSPDGTPVLPPTTPPSP